MPRNRGVTIPVRSPKSGTAFDTKVNLLSATAQVKVDRIQRFNANPRTRGTAANLLNDGAQEICNIAIGIAHQEFRSRSGARRPRKGSRHYVSSFFVRPATQDSIGRMIVQYGNSSPQAKWIEFGTSPHSIPSEGGTKMIFPFSNSSLRAQPGRGITPGLPGAWPTEFTKANRRVAYSVRHPGSPAFHILKRAKEAYLTKNRLSRGRRARL